MIKGITGNQEDRALTKDESPPFSTVTGVPKVYVSSHVHTSIQRSVATYGAKVKVATYTSKRGGEEME